MTDTQAAAGAPEKRVLNIAHRGASGHAPEHTFAAWDLALEQGADYIEQDLQRTKDGVLVVMHDETLDRTARGPAENCTGPIAEKTLEQLQVCEVGSWFNERYPKKADKRFAELKIPTLEQVFQRYGSEVNYYIETKKPAVYPGMEEELLRLMDEYELRQPARDGWRVLIQSFFPQSLQKIHALDPDLPLIQLMFTADLQGNVQVLDEIATYAVGIGPSEGDVDKVLVEAAHERCLQVHPYTLLEAKTMKRMIDLGVDGMFTNFPDRLDGVLETRSLNPIQASRRAAETHERCRGGRRV